MEPEFGNRPGGLGPVRGRGGGLYALRQEYRRRNVQSMSMAEISNFSFWW